MQKTGFCGKLDAMKYHHLFQVKKGVSTEEAALELGHYLTDIYEMADPETETAQIGGYSEGAVAFPELQHSVLEDSAPAEEIDWEKQWAAFAPDFQDGLARIGLEEGKVLLLKPGAGFGDLSHPTTRLVMKLMAPLVKDRVVFDIGCGSGILSITAALLDAKQVQGIDIDEGAIEHSRENARINGVEALTYFSRGIAPQDLPEGPILILMNMIESEQTQAWAACSSLHGVKATLVVSGLLSTQTSSYIEEAKARNWTLIQVAEEDGWIGLVFSQKSLIL